MKFSGGIVFRLVSMGGLLQTYLVINVTRVGWGKFKLYHISTYLLKVLVAKYLSKININYYLSLMLFCTLVPLKKSLKKKETKIEKGIIQVSKYASEFRRKTGN